MQFRGYMYEVAAMVPKPRISTRSYVASDRARGLGPSGRPPDLDSRWCTDRTTTVAPLAAPQLPIGDCGGWPGCPGSDTAPQRPQICATTSPD